MTKRRGDIHKDLRTVKYKMRVVADKKKKRRKRECRQKCVDNIGTTPQDDAAT